jgi:hypothetical protein
MKKILSSSISAACLALLFNGQTQAQELTSLEVTSPKINLDTAVELKINFLAAANLNWCGLQVNWGNGETQDLRIGDDNSKTTPVVLTYKYKAPGNYTITAQPRTLVRGLKTATSCDGSTKPVAITVIDQMAERESALQAERERAKKEAAEREQALTLKELELQRKELEVRKELARREDEIRKRSNAPSAPAPAPASPSTPKAVKPADAF